MRARNPYQKWATTSSTYAKKLRTVEVESAISTEEYTVRRLWNTRRICDLETHHLTRAEHLRMLEAVRAYHIYITRMGSGSWELQLRYVTINYTRECSLDTRGTVHVLLPESIYTATGVSGDHIAKILDLIIEKCSPTVSRNAYP